MSSGPSNASVAAPAPAVAEPALELLCGAESEPEGAPGSYYERSGIAVVEAGAPVAQVHRPDAVRLGPNVQFTPDRRQILATAPGQVRWRDGRIWIETILQIARDVDFSTGNIDFEHDVIVPGNVLDRFRVLCGGTLRVGRAIEAAEIRTGEDLFVGGAIAGKDKGRCTVGRTLRARFISNATIEAGADVIVENEISHSTVSCGGKLVVERGALLASHVIANGGIRCIVLGSAAGVKTIVEAGVDPGVRELFKSMAAKLDADQKQIAKVRNTIEPLLRNQKALSAAQKEQATELLFRASELEQENRKVLDSLRDKHQAARAKSHAEIHVAFTLYAGVIVRVPGLEATVTKTIRGPLRLGPDPADNARIVICGPRGSSLLLQLPTRSVPHPETAVFQRLVAGGADRMGRP